MKYCDKHLIELIELIEKEQGEIIECSLVRLLLDIIDKLDACLFIFGSDYKLKWANAKCLKELNMTIDEFNNSGYVIIKDWLYDKNNDIIERRERLIKAGIKYTSIVVSNYNKKDIRLFRSEGAVLRYDNNSNPFILLGVATPLSKTEYCEDCLEVINSKYILYNFDKGTIILTLAEMKIIKYLCQGFKVKEIANIISRSEHTVCSHRKNIYKKIKVHNVKQLKEFYEINKNIFSLLEFNPEQILI